MDQILDEGWTSDIVYMDFMKAFDKVPHERILSKLSAYGIGGEVLAWIRSFLTNRKQRVTVGEATSEWKDVTSGITQGSVLGPILFVLCINGMPESIENNSTVKMFADDAKLFKRTVLMEHQTYKKTWTSYTTGPTNGHQNSTQKNAKYFP